jgi:ketosteroid isomerase-like protein
VTELDRIEIVDSALRSLTAALRRRDADGVLALFHDDAVLFGSEDGELAVGALELREFLASIFDRPGTYGWSGWDPVLTGGTEDLVWFVAPAIVVVETTPVARSRALSVERGPRAHQRRTVVISGLQRG